MTDTHDPYQAPAADLEVPLDNTAGGSIEQTLAGNAVLEVGDVLSEAWQRTKGIKRIIVGGFLLVYALFFAVLAAAYAIFGLETEFLGPATYIQWAITLMIYPFMAGVMMVGIRQSVGASSEFGQLFGYYGLFLPILGVSLLQLLATYLGMILLILPGLYLSLALSLAIPLKVEKGLGIIESLVTSLKLVNAKFLNVFLLAIIASFGVAISSLTIIGVIWTMPWALMVYCITYRQLAGVEMASDSDGMDA